MSFDYENQGYPDQLDFPAEGAFSITPSDSVSLTLQTRGIYVGGAGQLKVDMALTGTVLFSGLSAGTVLPIRVTKVYATQTTATQLIGLY